MLGYKNILSAIEIEVFFCMYILLKVWVEILKKNLRINKVFSVLFFLYLLFLLLCNVI